MLESRTMKTFVMIFAVPALVLAAAPCDAAVIGLPLVPSDFGALGSLEDIPGWDPMATVMAAGKFRGEVTSQPFRDVGLDDYVYLYQIANTGDDLSWHMIEVLSLTPFAEADGSTVAGYLTGGEPPGFQAGTVVPIGASVNTDTGPTISFVFPGYIDPILPGEHGKVLYVRSDLPPDIILGNIINGDIAQGDVVGPIPEPGTLVLLVVGGLAGLVRRKR